MYELLNVSLAGLFNCIQTCQKEIKLTDQAIEKCINGMNPNYVGEAANSVRRYIPEYKEFYPKKYAEVTKHQHKRTLALTSRKIV